MRHLFLFFTTILLFLSCGEDAILEESEKGIVQVSSFYTKNDNLNVKYPDAYSKVYFYYGHHSIDFSDYSYQGEGKLVKGDILVLPDQSETVDSKGELTIKMKNNDIPFTIVIESDYYHRTISYSYSQSKEKIVFMAIFNP